MMQRLLQFTLDLFEPEPAVPAAISKPETKAQKPSNSDINEASGQEIRGLLAIEKIASHIPLEAAPAPAPQTLAQALAPAMFRHPRATRETLLGSVLVAYEFRRGKRRTIGFSAGPDGLTVSAPKWVPLYEIDKAVLEKSGWILKKLQETRDRHQQLESARIDWKDGCNLPFLGDQVIVVLDPSHAFGGVGAELKNNASGAHPSGDATAPSLALHIGLPHSATAQQIRDAVQAWLMRQAKRIFIERLDHFAPTLGVQWRKLSLSSAGTRWGSASADGSIRLNWRLVHFKPAVIDYVVVHELSHLRVMDHSPRFWDTVRAVVPDYADLRGQLKDQGVPRW
jgi:predicted metal-dependent hydrolase